MAAEEMLERLDDRFRVLSLPDMPSTETRYQHTLRGVIDWSRTLCAPQERLLWARLSVFSGGFDLSAAEAACGPERPGERTGLGGRRLGEQRAPRPAHQREATVGERGFPQEAARPGRHHTRSRTTPG
ncbi:regulator, partial [Streptomyces werraensis]